MKNIFANARFLNWLDEKAIQGERFQSMDVAMHTYEVFLAIPAACDKRITVAASDCDDAKSIVEMNNPSFRVISVVRMFSGSIAD